MVINKKVFKRAVCDIHKMSTAVSILLLMPALAKTVTDTL